MDLHIDIETYSSVNLKTSGVYKYVESIDFEILLIAYAFDDSETRIVDLAQGEQIPRDLFDALHDPTIKKHAHNAIFERLAFRAYGIDVPADQWFCSSVQAGYCGYPLSLEQASAAMRLGDKGKLATGRALIRFFCCPVKPTKKNGYKTRNLPSQDWAKWYEFREYCIGDVEAEREIIRKTESSPLPPNERAAYILDQKINDRGLEVDLTLARSALITSEYYSAVFLARMKEITSLDNPNSLPQLKGWLTHKLRTPITTLNKDTLPELIKKAGPGEVAEVLELRKKLSKTSIKKYSAMLNAVCEDGRAHGLLQFYGAARTGRWAGRLIQTQNLPRNYVEPLEKIRELIRNGTSEDAELVLDSVPEAISQLIRTAFVAKEGCSLVVADYSAIEARVIAWLAGEKWRLDVFESHGKIYEASASAMFGIPIEQITKESKARSMGKIAELALGYQGSLGALKQMGGEDMGLNDIEMTDIVKKWRKANPSIVRLWRRVEDAAKIAVKDQKRVTSGRLVFQSNGEALKIRLPSGRCLTYRNPGFAVGKFGPTLFYKGADQKTGRWVKIETYGGKLVENIVQATARDLLSLSMLQLDEAGFNIVMHVHDEVVIESPTETADSDLVKVCKIMSRGFDWSEGLPLGAEGFVTQFYKK